MQIWQSASQPHDEAYPTQQVLTHGLVPALRPRLEGVSAWSRDVATVALMCLLCLIGPIIRLIDPQGLGELLGRGRVSGFQVREAMPPVVEDGEAFGQYVLPGQVARAALPGGERLVLLGEVESAGKGAASPIEWHLRMNDFIVVDGKGEVQLSALDQPAPVLVGTAIKHVHRLVVGSSSVHTQRSSLQTGQLRIRAMGDHLRERPRVG